MRAGVLNADGIHKETIQKALKNVNSNPVPRVLQSVPDTLRLSLSVSKKSFNIIYYNYIDQIDKLLKK